MPLAEGLTATEIIEQMDGDQALRRLVMAAIITGDQSAAAELPFTLNARLRTDLSDHIHTHHLQEAQAAFPTEYMPDYLSDQP